MKLPSFTLIVSGVFMAYIAHSTWTIYSLFFPKPCPQNANCIHSYIARNPQVQLELWVYTSLKKDIRSEKDLKLLWRHSNFSSTEQEERVFNLSIPKKTRSNGTLYAHIFVTRRGEWPFNSRFVSHASITQTAFAVPEAVAFSLIGDDKTTSKKGRGSTPISHLKSKLTVNVMTDDISFDRNGLPMEVYRFLKITPQSEYLPIVYIDELSCRMRDYVPLNESAKELPVTVRYEPISVGKLRLWVNMQEAMKTLHSIGFSEKDTDEMKGIFADTNFYLLMLTFAVAAFHMLFDFLAFKNDISYWKNRNSMVGLSSRTVVWRCVSTIIIFLYLMDEETSLLVLIPAGIGSVIEVWKVTKAFKVKVSWATWRPSFHLGTTSDKEKETQSFDSQAMKYLSYLLYPLCMVGAVYSLLYTPHKSWRSWCIKSLVNGIYAFGFLFMLPQLFVNYKLKSVAHLPWRAFMYKAFNTFIDDVFAFIITMPTAHRIACFRDDIVFLVYLYQRWLYPVDKTRVNEYGQSFDSQDNQDKTRVNEYGQSFDSQDNQDKTRVNEYGQSFDSQDNQDKSEEESKKTK